MFDGRHGACAMLEEAMVLLGNAIGKAKFEKGFKV